MNNKSLSLDEARNNGELDRFAESHPTKADRARFDRVLKAMSLGVLEKAKPRRSKRTAWFGPDR
jgi:hypothetical protein